MQRYNNYLKCARKTKGKCKNKQTFNSLFTIDERYLKIIH